MYETVGRVRPAEKVRYYLRKPLVAHDHEWEGRSVGGGKSYRSLLTASAQRMPSMALETMPPE